MSDVMGVVPEQVLRMAESLVQFDDALCRAYCGVTDPDLQMAAAKVVGASALLGMAVCELADVVEARSQDAVTFVVAPRAFDE